MSVRSLQPGIIILGNKTVRRPAWFEVAKKRDLPVYYFREDISWEKEHIEEQIPFTPNEYERIDEIVEAASALARRRPIAGVAAFMDAALPACSAIASALGLRGPDSSLVHTLGDKSLQRAAFAEASLPSARFICAHNRQEILDAVEAIGFPVVLKPSAGAGSWGVTRVDDAEDLKRAIAVTTSVSETLHANVVVEEYMAGGEISVDAVVSNGKVLWQNTIMKPQPMEGPYFAELEMVSPAQLPKETLDEVYSINVRLMSVLSFRDGVSHTEYRITETGPRLLETHARPAGQYVPWVHKIASNVDPVEAAIDCAIGREPEIVPQTTTTFAGYRATDTPIEGLFSHVTGIDDALTVPNVTNVVVAAQPGDRVYPVPHAIQTPIAYVFATGESHDIVRAATAEGERRLTVHIDPLEG